MDMQTYAGAFADLPQSNPDIATDIVLIERLNARYALALDGILPDAAHAWADIFTADGRMAIANADGSLIVEATGHDRLAALHLGFPEIAVTRHWFGNLVITITGDVAAMTSYCVAILIKESPAASIIRTGIYQDRIARTGGHWRFRERVLTLDAASDIVLGSAHV